LAKKSIHVLRAPIAEAKMIRSMRRILPDHAAKMAEVRACALTARP